MASTRMHVIGTTVVLATAALAAGALFVWSGVYDFAADEPHTEPVSALLETMRKRSIERRAADVSPPPLDDMARVVRGAGNYEAMCASCHLAPGVKDSELSRGLYPSPPNLTQHQQQPAHAFWVIKHGIKASGMPAWGKSMGDEDIWSLTAFLVRLPRLDAAGYRDLVARSDGHSHEGSGAQGPASGGQGQGHAHGSEEHGHAHPAAAAGAKEDRAKDSGTAGHAHTHRDGSRHVHPPGFSAK